MRANRLAGATAYVASAPGAHKIARTRKPRTWLQRVTASIVLTVSMLSVGVGLAGAANAFSFQEMIENVVCTKGLSPNIAVPNRSGLTALGAGALGADTHAKADAWLGVKHTGYQKYQTGGAIYPIFNREKADDINEDSSRVKVTDEKTDLRTKSETCLMLSESGGAAVATYTTMATKLLVGAGSWIFEQSFNATWLDALNEKIAGLITGVEGSPGLADLIFQKWVNVFIVLGAIGWLITGVFLHRQQSAISAIGKTLVVLLLTNFFLAAPMLLVNGANHIVAAGTQSILGMNQVTPDPDGLCDLPHDRYTASSSGGALSGSQQNVAGFSDSSALTISRVQCGWWNTYVYRPWVIGVFGKPIGPTAGSMTAPEVDLGGGHKVSSWELYYWDSQVITVADTSKSASEVIAEKNAAGKKVVDAIMSQDGLNDAGVAAQFSGSDPGGRMASAFAALIAMIFALTVICVLSIEVLKQGAIFSLTLAFMPVLGLVGLVQFRVAVWGVEMMVNSIITRLTAAFLLVIVTTVQSAFLADASGDWLTTVLGIIVFSVAAMMFKNPLFAVIGHVSLGGEAMQPGKAPGQDAAKNLAKGAVNAAGGAALGGTAAAVTAATAAKGSPLSTKVQSVMRAAGSGAKKGAVRNTVGRGSVHGNMSAVKAGAHEGINATAKAAQQQQAKAEAKEAAQQEQYEQNAARYEADHAANKDNPAWLAEFQDKYGFPAPNPMLQTPFYGYGMKAADIKPEHMPRAKTSREIAETYRREAARKRDEQLAEKVRAEQAAAAEDAMPRPKSSQQKPSRPSRPSRPQGMN